MKQIPLFRQLGEAELTLLWAMGQEVGLPAGYAMETPAGEPPVLWVILDGRVDITFPQPRVEEGYATLFGPEIWGASSLVPPFASPGRAVTGTACRVLKLGAHEVRTLAEQNPRRYPSGVPAYQARFEVRPRAEARATGTPAPEPHLVGP